ncbi:MAG: M20/M25/M40 family metallo-hydrolase [Actinobacteria bacterium]|nr:M20/M25/M40 family metallo-hydrolase [Actinomycetota bacterium]
MKEKIIKYIDNNKKWLFETLLEIISKDTINRLNSGNENNGQDLVENIFRKMNLKIDRFSPDEVKGLKKHPAYLAGRNYSNRDNIVGYIGNNSKKTIIFSSHIDTVPTENLNWTKSGPLSPKIIGDKIYGIGALDMKGGLAASIFALKTIIDLGIDIDGRVILESVIDEEFGGANGTLACITRGYEGDFAIIPEPTGMNICPVCISQKLFSIEIRGKVGVKMDSGSNENEPDNPIFLANKLINALLEYENYLNSLKHNHLFYKDQGKPIFFIASGIRSGVIEEDRLWTTPDILNLNLAVRNYPDGCETEELFDKKLYEFLFRDTLLNKKIKDGTITFNKHYRFFPGPRFNINSKKNKQYLNILIESGKDTTNKELKISGANFAGDLFMFNNFSSTPAVFFGPGGGNAHTADEFVYADDIVNLSKVFAYFVCRTICLQ